MASTGGTSEIVFRGTDGNEREEFIAAIEELAFAEGWYRDRERMLYFARSRLRQNALRWFARLDPSKKDDWNLFVEALFDQYPPVERLPEAEIATPIWSATTFSPSVATAILPADQGLDLQPIAMADERQVTVNQSRHIALPNVRAYDPSALGRQIGILRIVFEDGTIYPHYVWRGRRSLTDVPKGYNARGQPFDQLGTTIDRQEALVVCFISTSEPHPIACLNSRYGLKYLSLYYFPLSTDSYDLYTIDGLVPINPDNILKAGILEHVSQVWNLLPDGSLQASLCAFDSSSRDNKTGLYTRKGDFQTTEIRLNITGASICFEKPGTLLRQDDPKRNTVPSHYETKARVVFEPL